MSIEQNGTLPLSVDVVQAVEKLDKLQLAWLSGYTWAKAQGASGQISATFSENTLATTLEPLKVTVLSASQTGNAKGVATKLTARLQAEGVQATHHSLGDYKAKQIADEQLVLLVSSTQGEGKAPEEGVVLLKLLNGKKAPKLDRLQFAVLGLGDSSYPNFCQAGKDFDQRFETLGGSRLLPRADADLDFKAVADQWIEEVVAIIKQKNSQPQASTSPVSVSTETVAASLYHKDNPFPAPLLTNQRITDLTAEKDVRHLEFDLSGSGLHYQAGDVLGVWFENDPDLVEEIFTALSLNGDEEISLNGELLNLRSALQSRLELTQNTQALVKGYAALTNNAELNQLVADPQQLQNFTENTPLVDLFNRFPSAISAADLVTLLRPLTPRLYSISSSPAEVGEEVHLSVGVVRYEHNGKARAGGASSYLADRVGEDETVRVFIEHNNNFRLPSDPQKPIIMIGSGTGIAPFRAFVQQRAADEAEGKNWLIFGNQHFTKDFLYQTEWQQFQKDGYLHKYSFAWSRDQAEKIYVQDKIREEAEAIWQWLQDGAYIYVCGDASRMAKDVDKALLDVIEQQGGFSREEAEEYVDHLREEKRYQRDVY